MNAVTFLESLGLSLELSENGKLAVEGLKRLNQEEREYALTLAKENKESIVEELQKREAPRSKVEENRPDQPDPAALAHAQRMLVMCPVQQKELHCWHCSRCGDARTCSAWRTHRADVEFFRQREEPLSLSLVEESQDDQEQAGTVPDYAAFCPSYWRGCLRCADFLAGELRFCAKYNRLCAGTEVVQ